MKKHTAAATIVVISLAAPAFAETGVSGTRDTVFAGGVFNFTLKEMPDQNFCISYDPAQYPEPLRNGAAQIGGWISVVNGHTNLSFTDVGAAPTQVCPIEGSHLVRGVGSNN